MLTFGMAIVEFGWLWGAFAVGIFVTTRGLGPADPQGMWLPLFVLAVATVCRLVVRTCVGYSLEDSQLVMRGIYGTRQAFNLGPQTRAVLLWTLLPDGTRLMGVWRLGHWLPRLYIVPDPNRRLAHGIMHAGGRVAGARLHDGTVETLSEQTLRESQGFYDRG